MRLLARPRAIPEIFHLYAQKPRSTTRLFSFQILEVQSENSETAYIIPPKIGEKALQASIAAKYMPLTLDMVQTTYRAQHGTGTSY
jgi:hypothetical protein